MTSRITPILPLIFLGQSLSIFLHSHLGLYAAFFVPLFLYIPLLLKYRRIFSLYLLSGFWLLTITFFWVRHGTPTVDHSIDLIQTGSLRDNLPFYLLLYIFSPLLSYLSITPPSTMLKILSHTRGWKIPWLRKGFILVILAISQTNFFINLFREIKEMLKINGVEVHNVFAFLHHSLPLMIVFSIRATEDQYLYQKMLDFDMNSIPFSSRRNILRKVDYTLIVISLILIIMAGLR